MDTQRQLDNLTKMRLRDLLSDGEYLNERTRLNNELTRLKEQLRVTESRAEHWLELTERTFEFATHARDAFLTGGLEAKKEILAALGSNQTLMDGKLTITLHNWLVPIANGYPALETEYKRLELNKTPIDKAKTAESAAVFTHWQRILNAARTFFEKNSEREF